jgi:hypothetical protein
MGMTENRETAEGIVYAFGENMPGSRFEPGAGTPQTALIKVTAPELVDLIESVLDGSAPR